jgi:hypothetical protein
MSDNVTWYAIYEADMGPNDNDSDFVPCASKDAAIETARGYLRFASGENSAAYAVAVPNSICTNVDENEWSLWDHLGDIPPADFVWLHRGSEYSKNAGMDAGVDIVDELRSLADGQDDDLGMMLERAAAEIQRLRALNK